ncbi:MAG: phosphodiester glycosidase family protein [Eubacterium sp.]|nr:phosphodiester glycosidase family protein [Eubacterium sp.]
MRKNKKNKKSRHSLWPVLFSTVLAGYSTFALLDTFVIPKNVVSAAEVSTYTQAETAGDDTDTESAKMKSGTSKADGAADSETTSESETDSAAPTDSDASASESTSSDAVITDTSYTSDDVQITITEKTIDDTEVYIADIQVSDPSVLLTGLADGSFGQNISEKTSEIAEEVNAILAINGDYYGFRSSGYVMRNGYLYRSTSAGDDQEDLVIYEDGTMEIIKEGDITAEELQQNGAVQIFSFGPGLVEKGEITVDANDEVDQAMNSNPRTAIGQISEGHYVMVVSDGRTSESAGLTLQQLAEVMQDLGCTTAYNLDGGGSTTMYFNGSIVNNPTSGHGIKERSVSDIVYIAE